MVRLQNPHVRCLKLSFRLLPVVTWFRCPDAHKPGPIQGLVILDCGFPLVYSSDMGGRIDPQFLSFPQLPNLRRTKSEPYPNLALKPFSKGFWAQLNYLWLQIGITSTKPLTHLLVRTCQNWLHCPPWSRSCRKSVAWCSRGKGATGWVLFMLILLNSHPS